MQSAFNHRCDEFKDGFGISSLIFFRHSFILRVMCGVLGILVTQEGAGNWSRKARVIVANYTSTLDHLAVELLVPNILVSRSTRPGFCNHLWLAVLPYRVGNITGDLLRLLLSTSTIKF